MTELATLDKFHLALHGDRRERAWWHLLSAQFPAYEVFWRRFVVPLTNRVDSSISPLDERWIRLRPDFPDCFERMAMCHYSIFYFLARATRLVYSTEYVFSEDVFSLLDSCDDNVEWFFESMEIIKDLGGSSEVVQKQPKHECEAFQEIKHYRNVMLHNTLLGRAVGQGMELLPSCDRLQEVEKSWRKAQNLGIEHRVHSRVLLSRLHSEVIIYLETKWNAILEVLEEPDRMRAFMRRTNSDKYLRSFDFNIVATTALPIAASGSHLITPSPSEGFGTSSGTAPFAVGMGNQAPKRKKRD